MSTSTLTYRADTLFNPEKRLFLIVINSSELLNVDAYECYLGVDWLSGYRFFVHRSPKVLGWHVTEMSSGCMLPRSYGTTRRKSIENATSYLLIVGEAKFTKAYKDVMKVRRRIDKRLGNASTFPEQA